MITPFLAAAITDAPLSQATDANNVSASWMVFQVFVVFCLAFAGLVRLPKRRT